MLLEKHSRVLTIGMEALMQDFEPRDAIPYMCSRDIFSEDQQEAIIAMPRRTLRVLEFVRQYRKTANTLGPLITYFEEFGQKHLACILSKEYVPSERPLLSTDELENRLSVEGNVPKVPYYREERKDLLESLEKLLIELSSRDQFWLVVHGFPGCGKSILAADVLYSYPVLLSRYYEHVIWITDGCTDVGHLPELFSNFVFLASDPYVLTGKEVPAQFLPLAKAALREKPNALVVLNDVYLRESVRWFDQLNCRILATSRNLDIFQVTSTSPVHFAIQPPGFTMVETRRMLSEFKAFEATNSLIYVEQLHKIHKRTAGLPALIGILKQQSNDIDSFDIISNIHNCVNYYAVATIAHDTYYKYRNMVDAIMESYRTLTQPQKMVMETFILFNLDDWIPLELISLCISMDIAGEQDTMYIALQALEPLVKSSLLDKKTASSECDSTDGDRPLYDFHINPVMHSFLCVTVDRQAFEDRLRSFIFPHVSSFLNDHRSVDSVFMRRIRSYTDLHPSLFRRIPYEKGRKYFEPRGVGNQCSRRAAKPALEDGRSLLYSKIQDKHKKQSNNGEEMNKEPCYTAQSWTDSCMFM